LYAEKAPLDIMLGLLDDKGTVEPQMPGMQPEEVMTGGKAMSMRALREGGQYRVIYTPGSTLAEGPEEKNQKILTFYQMGLLGTPGTPDASKLAISLMDLPETDKILKAWEEQEMKAAQQQQEAMAQQQDMMGAEMQAKDPMTQMQMEAMKQQMQIESHQAKNDIERNSDEQTAQSNHMRDLQRMAVEQVLRPESSTAGRNQRNTRGQ
jgi:hypothetical protein